ncbi:zinc ribbon domain-containing protein [Luteolibacter ambystomatis]|uniref:Zinc ribbon domain-containing protein n=1 Tax=Luteolibacter ambystomatis TaxID=2824561 RepID=A0A975G8M7_9BACT|nr:zinc ribbon domain-containing protein [Luteolibacter ambystomatis]QUE51379.1 zinc ribbon domain-containing protein [Luteolibacter ambystomatis]
MFRPSLTEVYKQIQINHSAPDLTDVGSRIQSLETQVEHLRALNRALIEHLADQSNLSPQAFLEQLSKEHPKQEAEHTLHCPSCGTLIASDAKACYSCGMNVGTDTYILG